MYQVSIALGKSAGFDVSLLQVPAATATPAASVALLIGEATTLTIGQIMERCKDCIDALISDSRMGGGLQKADMIDARFGRPAIVLSANGSLSAETGIAAVRNNVGNLDGQTTLILSGLTQCLEVFRETVLTSGLTIKP